MGSFKKGDKVICIDVEHVDGLTLGKVYTVLDIEPHYISVIRGDDCTYLTRRFIPFNQTLYWLYK